MDFFNFINYRGMRAFLGLAAFLVITTVLAVGWTTQPDRFSRGYAPEQPIDFSHKKHAGMMQIPCMYCHTGVTKSRSAGIPPTEICMNCHRFAKTDSPEIKKVAASFETGDPIAWKRIHKLPDHVYFDHRPHVNSGIACQSCHGEVQKMERVAQVINLRMGSCLDCHEHPQGALPQDSNIKEGPRHCYACHR
ncbi:MAG: cytochrome c3 family protein [Elusimicrobiota bacterium]